VVITVKKTLKIILLAMACGVFVFAGTLVVRFSLEWLDNTDTEAETSADEDDGMSDPIEGKVEQTRSTSDENAAPYSAVSKEDVSAIVDIVMPSVVSIDCVVPTKEYNIFGQINEYMVKTSGSGFLVSQSPSQLFICTNEHVIKDAQKVSVTFFDGSTADAMVVGYDTSYDLAIVSVDIRNVEKNTLSTIKIASIGNSDSLRIGDMNIAIGNSCGYGQAVTVGHIGALGREIDIDGSRTRPLIQTDAAINPGNSGGPLLDVYGQVIGINCAKYSGVLIEGIGYAIPVNNVVPTINELISSCSIREGEEGRLGIEGKDVSEGYSKGFSMPRGVYVFSIEKDSKASESELKVGDIITKINGQEVLSYEYLAERVRHYKAGTSVVVSVMRPQKNRYVEVEVNVVLDTLE
jgi:serine protease Do